MDQSFLDTLAQMMAGACIGSFITFKFIAWHERWQFGKYVNAQINQVNTKATLAHQQANNDVELQCKILSEIARRKTPLHLYSPYDFRSVIIGHYIDNDNTIQVVFMPIDAIEAYLFPNGITLPFKSVFNVKYR